MQAKLFHSQKILIIWITLNAIISGCSAPQESKLVFLTPSPSPRIIPTSSFGAGDITSISLEEAANLSNEEIVHVLVSQWLDGFKTSTSSQQAIIDYKIEEVSIQNPLTDLESEIESGMVAIVIIAIQPVGVPNDWASLVVQPLTEEDPWWHVRVPFRIVAEGENLILRTAFGWGT